MNVMRTGDAEASGDVERVSTKIAREVAALEGVDPTSLTPRLGEVIDPDAVDALFTDGDVDGHLVFTYCGHRVLVRNGRSVTVEPGADSRPEAGRSDIGTRSGVD